MYARVGRWTGVDAESLKKNVATMGESSEPPEGVPATGFTLLADEANGTVVVIGYFESEEDMHAGDEVLNSMNPPEGAMGTRASVDLCEVKLEMQAP